ncbi:MAG: GNAT family N-acetyltransferase [Clostridiales bacterium]|nr:GNAT family N-acetyltransferase [Clostridiales bacterium]
MIRFSQTRDYPQLKALFMNAFGDPKAVVDAFFSQRHKDENMLVDMRDDKVSGMLSMLPVTLCAGGGQSYKARYIYAVATREDCRRQGFGTALLDAAHAHMKNLGEAAAVLVPAAPDLFAFYEKRGYKTVFSLDVLTVGTESLPPFPYQGKYGSCSAREYARLRDNAFEASGLYVRWDESAVAYAVQTFAKPCGVTALSWDGGHGCAAWETDGDGILVKELALPDGGVLTALSVLHRMLDAKQYTVRLALGAFPGAENRPFGMIRWLIPKPPLSGKPPYLSLAMD